MVEIPTIGKVLCGQQPSDEASPEPLCVTHLKCVGGSCSEIQVANDSEMLSIELDAFKRQTSSCLSTRPHGQDPKLLVLVVIFYHDQKMMTCVSLAYMC